MEGCVDGSRLGHMVGLEKGWLLGLLDGDDVG